MKILKHQLWHVLILLLLLYLITFYTENDEIIYKGSLWNISTKSWFFLSIICPVIHQIYVLICWRYELFYKGITKSFGKNAFKFYKVGFTILILTRPIFIIFLSISNSMTIQIDSNMSYIISLLLIIPAIYGQYSVFKYFGINRAFGLDHFEPEKFKNIPFVKKGIFKYTSNGMYKFVFLFLWVPGVLLQSKAALLAALFQHIYIWVHYYFTELPDIKIIYEKNNEKFYKTLKRRI